MVLLKTLFLLSFFYILTFTKAQSTLPLCRKECSKLRGKCNISLSDLARTPCFDDVTNIERTCDCGITSLQQLSNIPSGTTLRDCVIPSLLFNSGSSKTVNARLENVHAKGYLNVGTLVQKGDIEYSTFCRFECTGRNRFQNCIISGSVSNSNIDVLSAKQEATLSITGPRFLGNSVTFLRSYKDIQIGNAQGFDNNSVDIFAQRKNGRLITNLGTRISGNRFDAMTVGSVQSFANIDDNTAGIATAEGPCNVINAKPIRVDDFLALPDGDKECAELWRKV